MVVGYEEGVLDTHLSLGMRSSLLDESNMGYSVKDLIVFLTLLRSRLRARPVSIFAIDE